jgi:riboflavin synthase alpha subunit
MGDSVNIGRHIAVAGDMEGNRPKGHITCVGRDII